MEKSYKVYILRSETIGRFYVGYTSLDIEERMSYHNYNNKGFTGKANDWKVIHIEFYESKAKAIQKEKQIKKRGARRYLEDLHKNK